MPIKVLIADDHPLIRQALTDLFTGTSDIVVVGECSDGSQVAEAVGRTQPDVVLMDLQMPVVDGTQPDVVLRGLQMPVVDGLEATRQVLVEHPEVRIVVLTGALTRATAFEAKALGVAGVRLKGGHCDGLPDQVLTVASGGSVWSADVLALVERSWESLIDSSPTGTGSPYVEESPHRYR